MIDTFTGFADVAKEFESDTDKGINDYDKRKTVSDVNHNSEQIDNVNSREKINIDKRIPNERVTESNETDGLSDKQKNELIDKGVSPKIINKMQFSEGVYKLNTENYNMADETHPDTKVPYKKKTVELSGTKIEGVFPEFESKYETVLPENLIIAKDKDQFDYCNEMLKEAVQKDPELRKQFSERQLEQIEKGFKPSGFIWHHNEERGVMQLVDAKTHIGSGHTGGKAIWGGGSEER